MDCVSSTFEVSVVNKGQIWFWQIKNLTNGEIVKKSKPVFSKKDAYSVLETSLPEIEMDYPSINIIKEQNVRFTKKILNKKY